MIVRAQAGLFALGVAGAALFWPSGGEPWLPLAGWAAASMVSSGETAAARITTNAVRIMLGTYVALRLLGVASGVETFLVLLAFYVPLAGQAVGLRREEEQEASVANAAP